MPAHEAANGTDTTTSFVREKAVKRKTAKELLAESFWELAEEKPIDRITVGEIVRNCGYSTATFYRHFKDKYDLIVWAYTQTVADTMNQIGIDGYPWKHTLLEGANAAAGKPAVFSAVRLRQGSGAAVQNAPGPPGPHLYPVHRHDEPVGARRHDGRGAGKNRAFGQQHPSPAAQAPGKAGACGPQPPGKQ